MVHEKQKDEVDHLKVKTYMIHTNKQLWMLSKGLKDKWHKRLTEEFEKSCQAQKCCVSKWNLVEIEGFLFKEAWGA